MRELAYFSNNVANTFDNNYDNMLQFNSLLMDASNRVYTKYSKEETGAIIREEFNKILGGDFKTMNQMQRRQAWRAHGVEVASLVEDVIAQKMNSGWDANNAAFMQWVQDVNLSAGDQNEFYVTDSSLLQVSKFAGDHHDIVRQHIKPGKSYSIETSAYTVKVYADFRAMQTGQIDFADMVDRMYASIEKARYDALYEAFMSADESLPTDMILETPVTADTVDAIVDQIELVKSVSGEECVLLGSRVAIGKLQKTVPYDIFSENMKNELYENGIMGNWAGYECIGLSRVNKTGTRQNILDNSKILILPVGTDNDAKFIKRVNEGDVAYYETGMDGLKKDMTVDAELTYWEGIGVVINDLFGEIKIAD